MKFVTCLVGFLSQVNVSWAAGNSSFKYIFTASAARVYSPEATASLARIALSMRWASWMARQYSARAAAIFPWFLLNTESGLRLAHSSCLSLCRYRRLLQIAHPGLAVVVIHADELLRVACRMRAWAAAYSGLLET